jgi:hypothetical protein
MVELFHENKMGEEGNLKNLFSKIINILKQEFYN